MRGIIRTGQGKALRGIMFEKKLYLISAVCILCGCGAEEKDPQAGMSQRERLESAANKIENDPEASPIAKRIADGALQRTKSDDDLHTFENGGN